MYENYNDFIENLTDCIKTEYVGIGSRPITLSRFITFLRNKIKSFVKIKTTEDIIVNVTIPIINNKLVEKKIINTRQQIIIKLDRDMTIDLLDGDCSSLEMYINLIIDELDIALSTPISNRFNSYLRANINYLSSQCFTQLKQFPKSHIISSKNWFELTHKSPIFKDYYNMFQEDKKTNRPIFLMFLKAVISFYD